MSTEIVTPDTDDDIDGCDCSTDEADETQDEDLPAADVFTMLLIILRWFPSWSLGTSELVVKQVAPGTLIV